MDAGSSGTWHAYLLLVLKTDFPCTKLGERGVGEGVARGRSDA